MDKAEYKIATEHIKKLISQGEYAEASHIADTIDWRRVRSVMMLCTISDLYKVNRRFEDAKELLYMAYERNPQSRTILYSLCDLSIKLEEYVAAIEYYKAFVEVAPKDTGRYVLQYRLYQAQDVSLEERIEVLEQLKRDEYIEKWAYELAYLYHRIGFATKCVEECDELILWFGKGRYVYKAMELKMLHEPLTPSQQKAYDNRLEYVERANDRTRILPRIDSGENDMTQDGMVDVTDAPTVEIPQEYLEQELQASAEDIQVKTLDVANAYNTMNLQRELADSLKELLDVSQTESSVDAMTEEEIADSYANTEEFAKELEEKKLLEEEQYEQQPEELTEAQSTVEIPVQEITDKLTAEPEEESSMEVETESEEEPSVAEEAESEEASSDEAEIKSEEGASIEAETEEPMDTEEPRGFDMYLDFIRSEETKAQIVTALENISMTPVSGNAAVTGHDLSTCFSFIKVLLMDLKRHGFVITGKTAKISAVNLNKKDPSEIVKKVEGGVLIIERVGRLHKDTIEKLEACLQSEISSVLIFVTDTDQGMRRFIEKYPALAKMFDVHVDIKDYSGEDLVKHAVKYAYDNEYSIDAMGELALRTRIEEMISNEDAPTMEDAQAIIDEAIGHVDKKNLKHFFDILFRKRYDDEDMVILKEEDFG